MPKLRDIAAELGVSPATVSRALNGFPEVNATTKAAVLAAAERMGYRPNQLAQKLVSGRSGVVGLVVHKPKTLSTDVSFFHVVSGIAATLAERNVDLILQIAAEGDELAPYERLIQKGLIDGVILNAPRPNDRRIAFLQSEGLRFVVHGKSAEVVDYPYFDIDNQEVGYRATEFVLDLGHRRIGLLNGPAEHAYALERLAGHRRALQGLGLEVDGNAIANGPLSEDFGYLGVLRLLRTTRDLQPTAIICASMPTARGAHRALRELGLSVPDDVSIVAHDDGLPEQPHDDFTDITRTYSPLTDACEPLAHLLLAAIDGAMPLALMQRTASPEFLVGRSTGRVPMGGEASWGA